MKRIALAFVPLLLFGIFAFKQTFAIITHSVDGIQCQREEKKDGRFTHNYYLVNRQAALHLGRILIESLLLNNLKNFVRRRRIKKKNDGLYKRFFTKQKTRPFSFTSKKCRQQIKQINDNYAHKRDNLPTEGVDLPINFVIKMFAHEDDGLYWLAEKVRSDVADQCNILHKRSRANADIELKKNMNTLCQLARKLVDETYSNNERVYEREVGSEGLMDSAKCKPIPEHAEECREVREKHIRMFLHDLWRYALSFVMIHRGDTTLEADSLDVNWQLKQYNGNGGDQQSSAGEEVAYLTYWPIKMLKQLGKKQISSQHTGQYYSSIKFKGEAVSELMVNKGHYGFVHVYTKKEIMESIQRLVRSRSSLRHLFSIGALFTLSALTEMQTDSIEEAMKEASTYYAAPEKPPMDIAQQASSSQAVVPDKHIDGRKTGSDKSLKGKEKSPAVLCYGYIKNGDPLAVGFSSSLNVQYSQKCQPEFINNNSGSIPFARPQNRSIHPYWASLCEMNVEKCHRKNGKNSQIKKTSTE